ncbi:MAG: hypothetical protein UX31_C0001G0030 [Candidatus Nomurabacteria bacterium GW2011_GWA1_46_11]|uniref:Uncharacterized protein n=2 Tax=Parcubacteria group TaxID=1794811 RepID=A0A1F8EYW6_9BACT|nr:MAG: hypothetical protein UX31_C0001G0030 [Candidatus Nomurabacteria bacterium GW2011_GWA1_46_11]OGN06062.1 MAG: hypothetical protein A2669_00835 [Candidatus Yanofskybacteria bacterium RIFCSPHIGHO2_01_FULL_48_25b]
MSEELPSPKKQEVADDRELIEALRSHGPEDPTTKAMLGLWVHATERELNESQESTSRIEMNIRRGRLFFAAGYIDEAFDSLSSAATQADNEGKRELYDTIMAGMDQMDSQLGESDMLDLK